MAASAHWPSSVPAGGGDASRRQPALSDDAAWGSFLTTLGPAGHGPGYHDRLAADGITIVPAPSRTRSWCRPSGTSLVDAGRRAAVIDVPKSPMGHDGAFVVADWMTHVGAEGPMRLSPVAAAHPTADRLELAAAPTATGSIPPPTTSPRSRRSSYAAPSTGPRCARAARGRRVGPVRRRVRDAALRGPSGMARPRPTPSRARPRWARRWSATWWSTPTLPPIEACVPWSTLRAPTTLVIVFSLLGMGANRRRHPSRRGRAVRAVGAEPSRFSRLVDGRAVTPSVTQRRAPVSLADLDRSIRVRNEYAKPYRALPFDLRGDGSEDRRGQRTHQHGRSSARPPATRQELIDVLGAVVDPDSGRPLVEEVIFTTDAYPGARCSIDAFVLWDTSAPITGAHLEGVGTIRRPPAPARSGNHRPGGWFVAAGPGIEASADPASCEIVDFGVSAAARLGVNLASTDGRVIREFVPQAAARSTALNDRRITPLATGVRARRRRGTVGARRRRGRRGSRR